MLPRAAASRWLASSQLTSPLLFCVVVLLAILVPLLLSSGAPIAALVATPVATAAVLVVFVCYPATSWLVIGDEGVAWRIWFPHRHPWTDIERIEFARWGTGSPMGLPPVRPGLFVRSGHRHLVYLGSGTRADRQWIRTTMVAVAAAQQVMVVNGDYREGTGLAGSLKREATAARRARLARQAGRTRRKR